MSIPAEAVRQGGGSAEPGANRTAILEFMVGDVDAVFARLKDTVELVHEPKLLPWDNRSVHFRDPEGSIVSLFMAVTDAARARSTHRRCGRPCTSFAGHSGRRERDGGDGAARGSSERAAPATDDPAFDEGD